MKIKQAPIYLSIALLGLPAAFAHAAPLTPAQKPAQKATTYSGTPVSAAVAEANKAELVARVKEANTGDIWPSRVVDELMTFKLSEEAWKTLLSDKGVSSVFSLTRSVGSYAVRVGLGDLERAESANNNARKANQDDVTEIMNAIKPVLALHIEATQPKVSLTASKLILTSLSVVGEHISRGDWKPSGGKADITLIMSPVAADSSVKINPAKTVFTITAPTKTEVPGWAIKIEKGLDRGK